MKKLVVLMLLIVFIIFKNVYLSNNAYAKYDNETNQQELYRDSLLSFLYPYISSSVDEYYGFHKQFDLYNAKIISIKKIPEKFEFEIMVQVETFTGAHNHPKGIEIITVLTSPSGTKIINFNHNDEDVANTDVPLNMKSYRYDEYGYGISYPKNYDIDISGGHSPVLNLEFGMRLSLYSKDSRIRLDIDSIDNASFRDKYQNIEEFIKYKQLKVKLIEEIIINNKNEKIYKLEGDNYYFSFFENDKYIFQLSSNSKSFLKKIMATFNFI